MVAVKVDNVGKVGMVVVSIGDNHLSNKNTSEAFITSSGALKVHWGALDMSIEPFNRLVKLATRAFYDDITTKGDNQPKTGRSDNRGIVVVMLDALTRVGMDSDNKFYV
ncbi:hypothetical protein AAG906_021309 [Vitis piasezkii]